MTLAETHCPHGSGNHIFRMGICMNCGISIRVHKANQKEARKGKDREYKAAARIRAAAGVGAVGVL